MGKNAKTVIEMTQTHIKLLHADNGRKPVLNYCSVTGMQEFSDEQTAKALSAMLSAAKIRSRHLTVVIPRRLVTLTQFRFPTHVENEIRKMIDLQIVHKVPYTREEIVFDYTILEKNADGYTKVLAAAVSREVTARYLKIFNRAGVVPCAVTISSSGLHSWYVARKGKKSQAHQATEAVIHIDTHTAEICFCQGDHLLFSRQIPFGIKDLGQDTIDSFVAQIGLTMTAYQKQRMGDAVAGILVAAFDKGTPLLTEKLQQKYILPVQTIDPVKNFSRAKNIILSGFKEQDGVSLAAGLGTLFGDPKEFMNLLPREVKATHTIKQRKHQWIKTGILLAGVFILAGLIWGLEGYQKMKILTTIQGQTKAIEQQAREILEKARRVDILREEFHKRMFVVDFIYALHSLVPEGMAFDMLDFNAKGALTVQGSSQEGGSVNTLQAGLVASPLFNKVTLQYARKRKTARGEVTNFKIVCQLAKPEEKGKQ